MDRRVFHCLGKILTALLDDDRGCQSVWGWTQSHTHTHPKEGGQWPRGFRSTHLLSASVPHFNKLSFCNLYKEITACALIPFCPFFLKAISSPVTTTPYPLSSPPPLYISLFSARCSGTLPRWPETSLLSSRTPASPWRGQEDWGTIGMEKRERDLTSIKRLSPTQIMTANSSGQRHNHQIKSETLLLVQLWGFSCSSCC